MYSAFLSYSRKDANFANQIYQDLTAHSVTVWIDIKNIQLGKNWDDAIDQVIRKDKISHFLVVLSASSIASENVKDEIRAALDRRIEYVIPLIIEDCDIPYHLLRKNHINFILLGYDAAIAQLLKAFSTTTSSEPESSSKEVEEITFVPKIPTPEQSAAAKDLRRAVRLLAGPGTGKSFVIEERVVHLLEQNAEPANIYVISFTRNSSRDLRKRIEQHGIAKEVTRSNLVSVTTLHSLALKALRKNGSLDYPVDPRVLDKWELEHIFDEECKEDLGKTRKRCTEIRQAWEAFWETGMWNHPNYEPPDIPVTQDELKSFQQFHFPATHSYSCVLPGEIVHKAVEDINAGLLDPVELLNIKHFIVDEFQDLNETDLAFTEYIGKARGVSIFIAGDDDQSLYSFRYANPSGIREFAQKYPDHGNHILETCFRCTPSVLQTAISLIERYSDTTRIPKKLKSHFEVETNPINGFVQRWKFKSGVAEANSIAASCKKLIELGVEPRDILILISNRNVLLHSLESAFSNADIACELPSDVRYVDQDCGRFALAILRVACDSELEDFIAHRTLLGLPKGVGIKTCNNIRKKVVKNNLVYLDIFYRDWKVIEQIFDKREIRAIDRARKLIKKIILWDSEDTIESRLLEIGNLLEVAFDEKAKSDWLEAIKILPNDMTLEEVRDYLGANDEEERLGIIKTVSERLENSEIISILFPPKVRIMTMHGVKGLNAQVVFIPGLEEAILPGEKRKKKTGLVEEAARLLYVSITRARAACVISYATSRMEFGKLDFRAYLKISQRDV